MSSKADQDKMDVEKDQQDDSDENDDFEENDFLKKKLEKLPNKVVVHPLVLLSVVDHYNRVSADTGARVAGVLLGSISDGVVDVTNSFAIPFEEDPKDDSIWFIDNNFVDNMFGMYRRVAAREVIVGWYSTGPKIRASDIQIHEMFNKYITHPVYVIVDVKPKDIGIPTDSYVAIEEIQDEKSSPQISFAHIPSEMGALEEEEIGVEHLLRDVKDATVTDLHSSVSARINGLRALRSRLNEIYKYLNQVVEGKLPINHKILYNLQDVFNLLPGLQVPDTKHALNTFNNDSSLAMYISSTVRTIIALHNLINNKIDLNLEESKHSEALKKTEQEKKEQVQKDEKIKTKE